MIRSQPSRWAISLAALRTAVTSLPEFLAAGLEPRVHHRTEARVGCEPVPLHCARHLDGRPLDKCRRIRRSPRRRSNRRRRRRPRRRWPRSGSARRRGRSLSSARDRSMPARRRRTRGLRGCAGCEQKMQIRRVDVAVAADEPGGPASTAEVKRSMAGLAGAALAADHHQFLDLFIHEASTLSSRPLKRAAKPGTSSISIPTPRVGLGGRGGRAGISVTRGSVLPAQ